MADIGTKLADWRVRYGDTLRSRVVTLRLATGTLDPTGGSLHALLFKREADMEPLVSPTLDVVQLSAASDGAPRWRIGMSRSNVLTLASSLGSVVTATTRNVRGQRTAYWTCSYEDATGARFPIYYGAIVIFLGASGV